MLEVSALEIGHSHLGRPVFDSERSRLSLCKAVVRPSSGSALDLDCSCLEAAEHSNRHLLSRLAQCLMDCALCHLVGLRYGCW